MSKADLADVKHKVIVFEPKMLEGKILNDPQKKEEVKPVRQNLRQFVEDCVSVLFCAQGL